MRDALKAHGTVRDIPGASCTARDLERLKPNQWLNDELVNFYGTMVKLRGTKDGVERSRFCNVHCFSSFFMTRYDNGGGHSAVKNWTKKVRSLFDIESEPKFERTSYVMLLLGEESSSGLF